MEKVQCDQLDRGPAVAGITTIVSSTVVMSAAGAYVTGDYVGTSAVPQSFLNVVRRPNGTGVIKSITITDNTTTAAIAFELWLYSATFTAPTDSTAWTISDAQNLTFVGVIPIATTGWYASGANKNYTDGTLGLVIQSSTTETSLYYAIVARGTQSTWVSGDLKISLGVLQD